MPLSQYEKKLKLSVLNSRRFECWPLFSSLCMIYLCGAFKLWDSRNENMLSWIIIVHEDMAAS